MLTTAWATPYALVKRGGAELGKRPQTRLAWITRAIAREGKIVTLKCRLVDAAWRPATLERDLDEADIVRQWRHRPSRDAIARAKRTLPITTLEGPHRDAIQS